MDNPFLVFEKHNVPLPDAEWLPWNLDLTAQILCPGKVCQGEKVISGDTDIVRF
ncbi:MAG: hypothetical protein WCK00_06035 [Deltaproteobacteria bacterium]